MQKGYDTNVKAVLPEFELVDKFATESCTVADILSHMTGVPSYGYVYGPEYNNLSTVHTCLDTGPYG